jgi:hypothetical protein
VLSWGAVQDDAFIHFRYANNLFQRFFVTYDGVHPNYGSSSLLYIGILALLRGVTDTPALPRAVSSGVHLLLFFGLAVALGRTLPARAAAGRTAGALLLVLLVTPSAVRWLDDGMETGLVVSVVVVLAWMIHASAGSGLRDTGLRDVMLGVLAFAAVLLRTELLLLCGVGLAILLLERSRQRRRSFEYGARDDAANASAQDDTSIVVDRQGHSPIWPAVAIAVGAAAAAGVILVTMRVLLPDTAVAKSHGIGHWFNSIHDTAVTLAGGFSFGAGMLALWLLTLGLVAMRRAVTLTTVLANSVAPVVLALSSMRGQEIQGVRYFAWTFAFSIVWNILELGGMTDRTVLWSRADSRGVVLLYVFAGLFAIELPIECVAMHRVLTGRSETMRAFESQHLEVLRGRRGVAAEIGYIGYFSGAEICDLAGLVNGREAARLSVKERANACAQTRPEFMFLNSTQFGPMAALTAMDDWKVCGEYDFTNVRTADRHYLVVRPGIAEEVCRATGRQPETVAAVFNVGPELVARRAGE